MIRYDIDGIGLNDSLGRGGGIYAEGFLLFSCIILAMQYKVIFLMSTTVNYLCVFWVVISIGGFYLFCYLYGLIPELEWYNIVPFTMGLPTYWHALFLVPVLITMIDYVVWKAYGLVYPSHQDRLIDVLENERQYGPSSERSAEGDMHWSITDYCSRCCGNWWSNTQRLVKYSTVLCCAVLSSRDSFLFFPFT
jgi:hypothetical protein